MREEYDLKKLKVKRRCILPKLQGQNPNDAKISITIALDTETIKKTLLQDSHFLREIANNIAHLPVVQSQSI